MMTRRQFLTVSTVLFAAAMSRSAAAAPYPVRSIRLIAGHPPGGQSDVLARIIAPKLGEMLGRSVTVENRSGAAGSIAATLVAKAAPDGYTLLICSSGSLALTRVMIADLPYDPIRDFTMITRIASTPMVLAVGHWIPATNVRELIEYAKARPGYLTAGSSGHGSSSGFTLELLKSAAGIDILQVPYGGLAPAVQALVSRQVDMSFAEFSLVAPHARKGTLRLLGTPGRSRFAAAPELPTLHEQGLPDVVYDSWTGIVAPAGLPSEPLARLVSALRELLRSPDVYQKLLDSGFEPVDDTPVEFAATVKDDVRRFTAMATRLGIVPGRAGTSAASGGS